MVEPKTLDALLREKERFTASVGGKTTWGSFLEQAVLCLEAYSLLPSAKAIRYNPYIYGVECPNCGAEEYPLKAHYGSGDNPEKRKRRRVIWKVKCSKCGKEYIALA